MALKEIYSLAQGGTAVELAKYKKNFDKKIIKEISKIAKMLFKPSKINFHCSS